MGHYDQAIWGITKKGYLLNTSLFNAPINKLGLHFDPIIYLFSPLYYLKPTATWLILAQALALSISSWPVYRLAVHYTQNPAAGFVWSVAYLINPFLLNTATWDFHPLTLAVPFVAYAVLAIEQKRFYFLLICCSIILLCKEHFGLMISGFGFLWAIRHRQLLRSLVIVCLGLGHFILIFHYVMPAFSPTGTHLMISDHLGQLSRYCWLGTSVAEIIKFLVQHPLKILHVSLIEMGGMSYLTLLLLPFLGISLLGASFLLPAMGDIAANLLSKNPMPRWVMAYHSVTIIPLICASAIRGSIKILRFSNFLSSPQLAGVLLTICFITSYVLTALPLPLTTNLWAPKQLFATRDPLLDIIHDNIGATASISVQANIGPHFSQRERLYTFPNKIGEADAIVLRLDSPTTRLAPSTVEITGSLANHLQMNTAEYLKLVSRIVQENDYKITLWRDPWLVLTKGHIGTISRETVQNKISDLEKTWLIQ